MDVEIVAFDGPFGRHLADFVMLVRQVGAVCGIGHEMAHPRDVRGFADELLGAGSGTELRERGFLRAVVGAIVHVTVVHITVRDAVDHRTLESSEDVGDRLIHSGDAGNGDRSRNDAHGIRGISGVLGLPQLVLTPPAQQVVVDHRHERHRLGVFAHKRREPGFVHRGDGQFTGLRIGFDQFFDRRVRIGFDAGSGDEQRCEFAALLFPDSRFDAPQQVQETVGVGFVRPRERKVGESLRPLQIAHGLQVAEVRLGRGVERFDDFFTAAFQLLRMLHHAHQQSAASRGGVLQLVDVGMQVAQTGGHASPGFAARHPLLAQRRERVAVRGFRFDSRGIDEHALDFGAGMRFLRGHGRGADEHAVHRHVRTAVGNGPFAGDVVGAAFRRADAAAGHQHEVRLFAYFGIRAQQQVIKRFP